MFTFYDLQQEVKRRAIRDQGGTQYDIAIKNIINTSLFRTARSALWRMLRRRTYFTTTTTYDTGSGNGSFTNGSVNVSVTGATFITDGITIGRRIKLSGDGSYHTIRTITAETALTLDKDYSGTATTAGTYSILGQEEYNLPIQASHRLFLWHEEYGYPFQLIYTTDQGFYSQSNSNTSEAVPTHYRMWGEDMVKNQPIEPSVITVSSSDEGDTAKSITIFGTVASYPDYETITTDASNGTNTNAGSKAFSNIERIVKSASTDGRIIVTTNSSKVTTAVLPVGDTTAGILYRKIQIYPLPNTAFDINVQYYKDPYRLVNNEDVHELGQEFDEAIILLSVAKIKAENSQKEAREWYTMWIDEVRSLRRVNVDKIDFFPSLKRPGTQGNGGVHNNLLYQQIGPYYGRSSRY